MNIFDQVTTWYSYSAFMELMEQLVATGSATGVQKGEDYIFWTKLCLQRLRRWEKTLSLEQEVDLAAKTLKLQIWWVITESWCGDASQTLPVMVKIAEASKESVEVRIILRDNNLQIMDRYLTNGISRSIPKLIAVSNPDGTELFSWGPRPAVPQAMMTDWKNDTKGVSFNDIEHQIHAWYAKDKGMSFQQEILALMSGE